MSPAFRDALKALGRVGVRAGVRAAAEVLASVSDDVEDLVDVGEEMAKDFLKDLRERAKVVKSRLPTEREMHGKPPPKRRP